MKRLAGKKTPPSRPRRRPPQQQLGGRVPAPPSWASCAMVGCLLVAVVVIVVSVAGLTVVKRQFSVWMQPFRDLFGGGEAQVTLTQPSVDQIRTMGRLETVDLSLSAVVTVREPHSLGDETLVYGVCGHAVAGVDLERLTDQDVVVNGTTITITLPPVEVFSVEPTLLWDIAGTEEYLTGDGEKASVLPTCNYTYSWKTPPFRDKTPEFIAEAKGRALDQFERMVAKSDVLERAQYNAEKELARLLMFLGFDDVRVVSSRRPSQGTEE